MGIRVYARLGDGVWVSRPLGELIKRNVTGLIAFVVICVAINNWDTVKELWFIGEQIAGLCFAIWVLRMIKRWSAARLDE